MGHLRWFMIQATGLGQGLPWQLYFREHSIISLYRLVRWIFHAHTFSGLLEFTFNFKEVKRKVRLVGGSCTEIKLKHCFKGFKSQITAFLVFNKNVFPTDVKLRIWVNSLNVSLKRKIIYSTYWNITPLFNFFLKNLPFLY